jgi:hypothetical protein
MPKPYIKYKIISSSRSWDICYESVNGRTRWLQYSPHSMSGGIKSTTSPETIRYVLQHVINYYASISLIFFSKICKTYQVHSYSMAYNILALRLLIYEHNYFFHNKWSAEKQKILYIKKSLKIPKGQSESVYWRRTDNTMAK